MQPAEPAQYRAYRLRCWEECEVVSGTRLWRFSLEDTRTGQRRGFASLDGLADALKAGGGTLRVKDDPREKSGAGGRQSQAAQRHNQKSTIGGQDEVSGVSTPPACNRLNCEHHPID
jgi:hypothetical protein